MEFFITQNSTLPVLKMEFNFNGKSSIEDFNSFLENSTIFFSMRNVENGNTKISNKKGGFTNKTFIEPNAKIEYYLYYKFSLFDTNKVGRYEGEFTVISDEGTLLLPIKEKLYINVIENLIRT
jgi:hypothetical protein